MKKYIGFEEKDIQDKFAWIMSNIRSSSKSLVAISQQLDGKRKNLDSGYAKEAYNQLTKVVEALNEFYNIEAKLPSFEEALSNLERVMKEDID